MSFPLPALDDRTFQDFVDEAKRRIPLHTPEWTDHNVSDPGVALIELFAWMAESITYRLNMVPDRLYRSFLDLVGVGPYEACAATTPVTFWIGPNDLEERTVQAGTRVATAQDPEGGAVEFMTTAPVTIRQPILTAALTGHNEWGVAAAAPTTAPTYRQFVIGTDVGGIQHEGCFEDALTRDGLPIANRRFTPIDFGSAARAAIAGERAIFAPSQAQACFPVTTGDSRTRLQALRIGAADTDAIDDKLEAVSGIDDTVTDASLDQALYFGFEESLAGNVLYIDVTPGEVQGNGIKPEDPPLEWEVSTGSNTWQRAEIGTQQIDGSDKTKREDTTQGLNVPGRILLYLPPEHTSEIRGEVRAFWLRVRLTDGTPAYGSSPTVARVTFKSLGASVMAEHAVAVEHQELGASDGTPGQSFSVLQTPVLPRRRLVSRARQETREELAPDGTTRTTDVIPPGIETLISVFPSGATRAWQEVDNFARSGRNDRHFTWDSSTGDIRLGPAVRDANGIVTQRGVIPEAGTRIVLSGFRSGGGSAGNVPPDSIVVDRSGERWVQRVNNRRAATGGVDAETIENAKVRGPLELVTGGRAVTTADYEHLAVAEHHAISRATCRAAEEASKPIRLRIVCRNPEPAHHATQAGFLPDNELLQRLKTDLDSRRLAGVKLDLGPAEFRGVSVVCEVIAKQEAQTRGVRVDCLDALYRFVHPSTGGPKGEGWEWGLDLDERMIASFLETDRNIEKVSRVLFFQADFDPKSGFTSAERTGIGKPRFELPEFGLPVSWQHSVIVQAKDSVYRTDNV